MKNWFEKKSTTNILLLGIVVLLGAHLIINVPIISMAKAQSGMSKTQSTMSQDTSLSYQMSLKTQEYLKSIDQHIVDIKDNMMGIKDNTNSIKSNMGVLMQCTRNTPTGDKAFAVKNIGVQ